MAAILVSVGGEGVVKARKLRVQELGSQKKYERVRKMRAARKAGFQHSTRLQPNTGHRFLTEDELNVWFNRVNAIRNKKLRERKL